MPMTYYVQATISGDYAACKYFYDKTAKEPVEGSTLRVDLGETSCIIEQAEGSELTLLGASYKTIGSTPAMNDNNFCPADDQNAVTVPMPTGQTVTKGAVLLFSNGGAQVESLYASADPEVTNAPGL